MTDPVVFINKIWSAQRASDGEAYGFTSKKDWETGAWADYPTQHIEELEIPDNRDLYFCPNLFRGSRRTQDNFVSSRWLYADLDEVDARTIRDMPPTLGWETSPGRFQALWLLDRSLNRSRFERLNKRLTYHLQADLGGWSCTKVLRVPGSVSTKYGKSRAKRFDVHLVCKGKKYRVEDLMRLLPPVDRSRSVNADAVFGPTLDSLPSRSQVMKRWRGKLPRRAERLLRAKGSEGDDRSARLWELYNLLLQGKVPPAHILVLVRGSVWNKYAGQNRELAQLQSEIAKAAEKHAHADEMARLVGTTHGGTRELKNRGVGKVRGPKGAATNGKNRKGPRLRGTLGKQAEARMLEDGPDVLPFLTHEEFMTMHFPKPEWLVEGFWSKGAYGVCVGEYKAFKTTILLDLAMSVASGRPFLQESRFDVKEPGRVLYLHEEGRQGGIQDRLHRIAMRKGLGAKVVGRGKLREPKYVSLDVTSFSGFKLSDEDSQLRLVKYIEKYEPKLIIMESWYLIASDVDENSAGEVAPVLDWITTLSQEFGVGIIISHHYTKNKDTKGWRAIDRISGSGVFGRWFESAIALERTGSEEEYKATIEAMHREQKGVPKQTIAIEIDGDDEDDFDVRFVDEDIEVEGTVVGKMEDVDAIVKMALADLLGANSKGVAVSDALKTLKEEDIDMDFRELKRWSEENGYRTVKRDVRKTGKPIWAIVKARR